MNGSGTRDALENLRVSRRTAGSVPLAGITTASSPRRELLLVLSLLPILAGLALLVTQVGGIDVTRPRSWLALGLGAGGWIAALACGLGQRSSAPTLLVVVVGAVALRMLVLASDPGLSDDVNRYVWEGALLGDGIDPFRLAPNAPALAPQRARWPTIHAGVNHREVPAAYPPLAQAVHAGVVALAGGASHPAAARYALRLCYGLADLWVCLPLATLLARRGRSRLGIVAWAWNPWLALEFAGSAHLDALAILLMLAGLAALPARGRAPRGRGELAAAALVAAGAVKLLPLALVPFALRSARARGSAMGVAAGCGFLCLAPFVLATGHLPGLGGLGDYAFRWESFNLGYRALEPLFARGFPYDESLTDPRRLARALVLVLWLGVGLAAWRRGLEPARAAAWLCGGFLVLTPTLHPWYLAWIVPFVGLFPGRAWVFLCALAPLLYWPLARWRTLGVWEEPRWLFPVVALPFLALLALEGLALRRRKSP